MTHTNHVLGELLAQTTVIPVMVVKDLDDAIPMAKELVSKGFNTLEITLRTECGILAIAGAKVSDRTWHISIGAESSVAF